MMPPVPRVGAYSPLLKNHVRSMKDNAHAFSATYAQYVTRQPEGPGPGLGAVKHD